MRISTAKVKIFNMPRLHSRYVVARLVDGDLWYFGSFDADEMERANKCRREIDGIIAEVEDEE